jgi:two-component system sensor histidine kinase KdpD
MALFKSSQFRRFAVQVALGSAGVALLTFVCFQAHLNFSLPCLFFLLLVVLQSLYGGFAASAVVSVIAAVCLEYFFIPPVLEWQINDPEYAVALLAYLFTSLVITRLASRARDEARTAERRRRDAVLLYDVASRMLSLGPQGAPDAELPRICRECVRLAIRVFFRRRIRPADN